LWRTNSIKSPNEVGPRAITLLGGADPSWGKEWGMAVKAGA